jgi:alanine-glyoxylate transaminase/serine-glyoxylate transaminase/serine-pyruvate transaminase
LSLISRHLDQRLPLPELNTPFSTERDSLPSDDLDYKPIDLSNFPPTPTSTMSAQAPHNTLLIPGPIEFDDAVLQSMAHYA